MNSIIRRLTVAVAAVTTIGATASVASAQAVWGTTTNMQLVGSRSITGGGLIAGVGGYSGATVTWNIAPEGDLLRYTYTFSGLNPNNNVSHAIFSLSPNCTRTNGCVTSVTGGTPEFGTFDGTNSGNPGMPNSIFGVKINTTAESTTYSFLSNRVAVWGDIYLKGGNNYTYNAGLLTANARSNDINFFIARPDTEIVNVVPEPSTYAMMGLGMLGLVGVARRRRAQG